MKIELKELNKLLKQCSIESDYDLIDNTPFFAVHHKHDWDHGYEGYFGVKVSDKGEIINGLTFFGTRREFYADMQEMILFLIKYFDSKKVKNAIIAPCFRYSPFNSHLPLNDIYNEINYFLKANGLRRNGRSGIVIKVPENMRQIEMVVEGAFRGISNLCIFLPEQQVLLAPNHHFGIGFYMPCEDREKEVVTTLLKEFSNLCYFAKYL